MGHFEFSASALRQKNFVLGLAGENKLFLQVGVYVNLLNPLHGSNCF